MVNNENECDEYLPAYIILHHSLYWHQKQLAVVSVRKVRKHFLVIQPTFLNVTQEKHTITVAYYHVIYTHKFAFFLFPAMSTLVNLTCQ